MAAADAVTATMVVAGAATVIMTAADAVTVTMAVADAATVKATLSQYWL
jgi:hypothetical protein